MDWLTQSQEVLKGWTDVQMKTWETWLKAVQEYDKSEPRQIWETTVDAWHESMNGTLNAQLESSRIWAKGIASIEGAPDETGEWAKQVQEMTKNWTEMQKKMWDNWFEAVKKADPSKLGTGWDAEGSNMLKSWQDMAQKALETQTEWMKNWPPKAIKTGGKK